MPKEKIITLKWLEEYCNLRLRAFSEPNTSYGKGVVNTLNYLLKAARTQAKKEGGK